MTAENFSKVLKISPPAKTSCIQKSASSRDQAYKPWTNKVVTNIYIYTLLSKIAHKFDGIMSFGFNNNSVLVVGHMEYGEKIVP